MSAVALEASLNNWARIHQEGKTEAIQTSVNRLWRCLLVVLRLVLVLLTKRSLTMVSQSKNLRLGLVTMIIKVLYGPVLLHFLRSTSRR
ncbi:Uncharacterised protein [Vibrio cholerae]|nr:Uncharacterised protein [Vibrio cholerae]